MIVSTVRVTTARALVESTHERVFGRHRAEVAQQLVANPLCAKVGSLEELEPFLAVDSSGQDGALMKALGSLQASLMCVNSNGARTYDLFFATLLSQGLLLPDSERAQLYNAYFNAALLSFDQVQHTGRSLIQMFFTAHSSEVRTVLKNYPVTRRGLFAFGPRSGQLVQLPGPSCGRRTCKSVLTRLLDTFEEPGLLGLGRCPLTMLAVSDFRCTVALDCKALQQDRAILKKLVRGRVEVLAARHADIDDFESIALLTRWAGLTFGDDFMQVKAEICAGGLGAPVQPWSESSDLMACLIAAREEAQGAHCESLAIPQISLDIGGVGTAVWDRQCVANPLAQGGGNNCTTYGTDGGTVEACAPEPEAGSGANGGHERGNEPKAASGNTDTDRATRGNALLSEAKVTLSPISRVYPQIVGKIADQCRVYNSCGPAVGRTKAVTQAMNKAVANGHYAQGSPIGTAEAQTCAKESECGDGFGDVYMAESLITASEERGSWQNQVLLHELLHIVYSELGFSDDAGPERSREGAVIPVDRAGTSHHRLIDQITSPGHRNRIYNPPKMRDPMEPEAFGVCSAAAERARQQFSCWEGRVARGRGTSPRALYPRASDPRVINPLDIPGSAPPCTSLSDSTLPRPPTACGLMLCAGAGECECNATIIPASVDGDATFVSPLSIDCQPGQIPDPARGGCVDIGGE
jgi:hypothetical protein